MHDQTARHGPLGAGLRLDAPEDSGRVLALETGCPEGLHRPVEADRSAAGVGHQPLPSPVRHHEEEADAVRFGQRLVDGEAVHEARADHRHGLPGFEGPDADGRGHGIAGAGHHRRALDEPRLRGGLVGDRCPRGRRWARTSGT